jgi:hypothetical protein
MSTESPPTHRPTEGASFAETALALGGKSADEARRTGAIDTADDQVEALFAPEYQTVNSPAHRAVWDRGVPLELFMSASPKTPPDVQKVMDDSVAAVQRHKGCSPIWVMPAIGACWSAKNTVAPARRSVHSRRFSRGWRSSTPRLPALLRSTVALVRSILSAHSVTRSRSNDSCPGWRTVRGSVRSLSPNPAPAAT